MKRVLSIQDLSCLGKCSLTVALPVLSSMGCTCSVLPTAVLSTHTAFPSPHCRSLTEDILPIAEHWSSVGAEFDAITVGYLADPLQAEKVSGVLKLFQSTVILDPAMGDHGRLYSGQTPEHVQAMAQLCRQADFLLPNLTEAALLTNLPYREDADTGYLQELADGMLSFGAKAVVITGFTRSDGKTGFFGARKDGSSFTYQAQRIPKHFHGTGDLFAAVLSGQLLKGETLSAAAEKAAEFVKACVENTPQVTPMGVEFETQLYRLTNTI